MPTEFGKPDNYFVIRVGQARDWLLTSHKKEEGAIRAARSAAEQIPGTPVIVARTYKTFLADYPEAKEVEEK